MRLLQRDQVNFDPMQNSSTKNHQLLPRSASSRGVQFMVDYRKWDKLAAEFNDDYEDEDEEGKRNWMSR